MPLTDVAPKPPVQEQHIGDGLYASYDGYQVKLRAPREFGDHEVFLEPRTFAQLLEFVRHFWNIQGRT